VSNLGANCGNCAYRSLGGLCLRYPPQAFIEWANPQTDSATYSQWRQPYVDPHEWCGEYKPKDGLYG
jgi:hypothetical protein